MKKISEAKRLRIERRKNLQPKFYVTMTDKFLSNWGMSKGKINKFVVAVPNYEKATIIKRNAQQRSEMKFINITTRKPRYNKKRFLTSMRGWGQLGDIWKK